MRTITMTSLKKQNGAALVVGLILLVVVTVLAISGMNTATTELALARNDQNYESAFQAAETGIEFALSQSSFNTLAPTILNPDIPAREHDKVDVVLEFEDTSLVPDKAFSLGVGSGIAAYHFTATATAESARTSGGKTSRDASAVHTQAFYVVGPEAPTL
jgi:type IV pilus assembly protein PilX